MKKNILAISGILLLAACSEVPKEAYFNRGAPESLLDVSSEVVTVPLTSPASIDEVVGWIDEDQPTRAELLCFDGDNLCNEVKKSLRLYGVEYEIIPSKESELHLIYERVLARDCDNRFIDNHINPYNLNHPTFGCSISSNMVQMVADRRQFVSPELLGNADAELPVRRYYGKYLGLENYKDNNKQDTRYTLDLGK